VKWSRPALRQAVERFLEAIVLVLIASLTVVVVVGVGFRKAGAALVWYDEVASILLAWLTYYGACLAALKRAHIGFPRLAESLPRGPQRFVLAFRETVVLAFFVLVAWAGWKVMEILGGTPLVSLPWVPARVAQSVIPISAVLFIVAELFAWMDARRRGSSASEPGAGRAAP
jgi:TRAP-type C4-dicarboxylate transport system permease small subunit